MLAYLLAITVGLGSLGLYLAAFLFQEIHRKYDLLWSGVGMFYALVLWVCGDRITGGLLLGQMASVALLGWFGWQVMQMRWEQMPLDQREQLPHSAASFGDVLRARARQVQINLRNSEWRSSSLNQLNRLAEKSVEILIAVFDWGTALVGTTVKSWEKPMPTEEKWLEQEERANRD
jgi:Ycf66 protein N-terminus